MTASNYRVATSEPAIPFVNSASWALPSLSTADPESLASRLLACPIWIEPSAMFHLMGIVPEYLSEQLGAISAEAIPVEDEMLDVIVRLRNIRMTDSSDNYGTEGRFDLETVASQAIEGIDARPHLAGHY